MRRSSISGSSGINNNSRRQQQPQHNKRDRDNNMNNRSMRSLRRSLNVKADNSSMLSSIYSPKTCPICMESYRTNDEIAWSRNKDCQHAFHLDCIMGWLLEHDSCPMCRNEYLNAGSDNDDDDRV